MTTQLEGWKKGNNLKGNPSKRRKRKLKRVSMKSKTELKSPMNRQIKTQSLLLNQLVDNTIKLVKTAVFDFQLKR